MGSILEDVTEMQKKRLEEIRNYPGSGTLVDYLGKKFFVRKNVFSPFIDNRVLTNCLKVDKGESVLDVCTGSGVIGVFAAYKGAARVVGTDINPDAVECAKRNAQLHGFENIMDFRACDMFGAIGENERFDVITGNLPFRNKKAKDLAELSMWDTNLQAHRKFFKGVNNFLRPGGRIYLSQANFGAVKEMKSLARKAGFGVRLAGQERKEGTSLVFYAFELARNLKHPAAEAHSKPFYTTLT